MTPYHAEPCPPADLKQRLGAAGFASIRLNEHARGVPWCGRARDWLIVATISGEWLNLGVVFCCMPDPAGLRTRLTQRAMERNRCLGLVKFGALGGSLVLELDYRLEHVDEAMLVKLVRFIAAAADDEYPAMFRIVTGDEALDALGRGLGQGP